MHAQVNYYSAVVFLTAACWWFGCALAHQLNEMQLLEVHNKARISVDPPAKNMFKMEWNDELARVAEAYAKKCRFESNEDRHHQLETSNFTKIGENIYAFSGSLDTLDYETAVEEWKKGDPYYKRDENKCDDNKKAECESYIQLVSARTHAVGCGVAECKGDRNILVCNYGPTVNLGEEPAYTTCTDDSCSGFTCPEGYYVCDNKLCCRTATPAPRPPDDCAMPPTEQCFCMDAYISVTCDSDDTDMCNNGVKPGPITRCFCYKIAVHTRQMFRTVPA